MVSKARKAAAQASYQQGERKNFVRNGDMAIAQSLTQSIAASGGFAYGAVDGWKMYMGSAAAVNASQDAESPDGFNNSLKLDITTAETSVAAGDIAYIEQRFEGLDLQSINKGDAQAKAVTASFWVRSPVTGIHIVELLDLDNGNRSSSQSYTIASADTWEYHSVTFPPDTTGTLDNNNDGSLKIQFWLVAGTNFNPSSGTSLNTSWGTTTAARAVGQVNVLADDSDNFYLTGVQMELGNTGTDFQYESFKENLSRCQRYFVAYGPTHTDADDYVVVGTGLVTATANGWVEVGPPVPMRHRPSITFNNMYLFDAANRFLDTVDYVSVSESNTLYQSKATIWLNVVRQTTDMTVGRGLQLYTDNATDSYFWVSAEL